MKIDYNVATKQVTLDATPQEIAELAPSAWIPRSGERFYVMVSGHARASGRNVLERSDPVKVRWP